MPNVNVTYDEMRQVGTDLHNSRNDIDSQLQRLRSKVDALVNQGYVTDSSSKQFNDSYQQFHQGATNVIGGLDGMGKFLEAAASAFEETDQKLKSGLQG